jgi:flagellar basal-body rod protein FlgC
MEVNYLNGMKTSASALAAHRRWMDAVSANLANAQTTRTPEGGPYRRQQVIFESIAPKSSQPTQARGTAATDPARTHPAHLGASKGTEPPAQSEAATVLGRVVPDTTTPFSRVYDPGHPDADSTGYVEYPNVNPVTEMVNLILASRAYEANVAALAAEKRMQEMALSIGKP